MSDQVVTKVFLFDIDGTLLMAGGCGRSSFIGTWAALHGQGSPFDTIDFTGRTDTSVFAQVFSEVYKRPPTTAETEAFFDSYHALLKEKIQTAPRFRLLPGVREVLAGLTAGRDCIVGLVTGNTREGAMTKLKRADLEGFFSCGGFGSDSPDRATLTGIAIERAARLAGTAIETTVIGDSLLDAAAARANGARIVLVASGGTPSSLLAGAMPDELLEGMDDWEMALQCLRKNPGGLRATTEELDRAARIVRNEGVILYPTSTLYGIGGSGLSERVATRVRNIKNKPDTPLILLAADTENALELGRNIPEAARALAQRFWPGPLTLVFPAADLIPTGLRGPGDTIAVRVDPHPWTRALCARAGCPLISTSANISGEPPPATATEVDPRLIAASDMFVIDDASNGAIGLPSTIIGFFNGEPVVIRQGAIDIMRQE